MAWETYMSELSFQFISMIIAINIPLLFVAVALGNSDSRRILLYFCWGVCAGAAAFALNSHFDSNPQQAERLHLSIAPLVEEILKGLPLLLFLNEKRYPHITKVVVFCAMVSGIGFSVQESMYYFSVSSRAINDVAALSVRSCTTALMHGMTTAAIGIGLLLFQKHKHIMVPLVFSLFALSASIHALFNMLLETPLAFVGLVMPLVLFFGGRRFLREWTEAKERTLRRDFAVVLTGFLALGAFLMDIVYSVAYIFLYGGGATDITVGFFSRSCAYAFLAFTIFGLLLVPEAWRARMRILVNIAYAVVIGCILYGVVVGNERLLFHAILILALGSAMFALWLLVRHTHKHFFACVVMLISALEIWRSVLELYSDVGGVSEFFSLIYLPAYALLAWAVWGLRSGGEKTPG